MPDETTLLSPVELATELTVAWLSNPNTRVNATEIPEFLKTMHTAVEALTTGAPTQDAEQETTAHVPAVTARRSLASKDHIISLIDGKPYKTLRRHLSTHGLTPQDYRQRYGLKPDYPMVAPTYAEMRRDMARKIGLGRKPGQKVARSIEADAPATSDGRAPAPAKRRGRPPKKA